MSKQNKNSRSAFTVWEILVLVCIAGIVCWAAIPNFIHSGSSPANACINLLHQIDTAANEFALTNHLRNGDRINFPNDLTPYIKLNSAGKIPLCPQGGIYYIGKVGQTPICTLGNTVTPAHVLQ